MSKLIIQPEQRLRHFVHQVGALLDTQPAEAQLLPAVARALAALVAHDDWLPDEYAVPDPQRYRQYLLHADTCERFSVVSFVWGPGQFTPVHNHTVWGAVGVLRGAETAQAFGRGGDGQLRASGQPKRLEAGEVDLVSPSIGDVHQVSNALAGGVSVSIHVYGGNIGAIARSTFEPGGAAKPFISGYSNTHLPNIWAGPLTLQQDVSA
ncbi:3-mercaptopropionate dioxygenase [Andreprevotia sp. IGB-42]|uniref:cysteine dioxygenase family protein n=1 Tax=Andreprevotia sp. IGB-42 TaxID=2497473 RepID=UPI00135C494E|nr:cysteine dioxygenase [Andreprevotia sp. IGB-42]KAF0812650.1 3-mercaptopropionate dioxygenase [Andreprevotia sp. IGB-42]